ncbi:MAG: tol-pal system YbgF family protein [Candidatus Korobacteraceae bacterium]
MVGTARAQDTPKIALDNNETVFSVVAAINHCGYDQDLGASDPVRAEVRTDMARAVAASAEAKAASDALCAFYREHTQPDASRTLAQFLSLALNLDAAPEFQLKVKEPELPPDAAYVLGFRSLLQRFYKAAQLGDIFQRHQEQYTALVDRYHLPVSSMLTGTDVYLRMPISGYLGRSFLVVLEPMAAPGQVNARNYGSDYFMVISPERGQIQLDALRHSYLHFVLDPLMLKRAYMQRRLQPLLLEIQGAPLDRVYKSDVGLLATESLIRAIEARLAHPGEKGAAARQQAVDSAVANGFILARYFNETLEKFEQQQEGLREVLPDWLFFVDVRAERRRASNIIFASQAAPDVMNTSPATRSLLDSAEQRMAAGDFLGAGKLAQQALDEKRGEPGRAYFLLAQAATLNKDGEGARNYFLRTLEASDDPRIVAWTHIYLGRMADMQEERETALEHYQAAIKAGDTSTETRTAAERGLKEPYAPQRSAE